MWVGRGVSGGIDRRCDGVWGCRRVAYEPGLAIALVHGSEAGDTEAGPKLGKSVIHGKYDAESPLYSSLEFRTNKGGCLRFEC